MDRNERAKATSLDILNAVFSAYPSHDFAVQLWDGTTWPDNAPLAPAFTLRLNHPGTLRKMFLPPSELNLGESFIYGDFDIDGDLSAAYPLAEHFENLDWGMGDKLSIARRLLTLPNTSAERAGRQAARVSGQQHSRARDRQAISYHYDVSSDFYALWLDQRMIYSCAYFADAAEGIDTAQERKLDYICRKLRLQPGERLLDIGCGWGGLVIYAAKHYGVDALGISLSQPQVDLARDRIAETGLADRCRVRQYLIDHEHSNAYTDYVLRGKPNNRGKYNLETGAVDVVLDEVRPSANGSLEVALRLKNLSVCLVEIDPT